MSWLYHNPSLRKQLVKEHPLPIIHIEHDLGVSFIDARLPDRQSSGAERSLAPSV